MSISGDLGGETLSACSDGNIAKLEAIFRHVGIGINHAQNECDFQQLVAPQNQIPSVPSMLLHAIRGQQLDTLSYLYWRFQGSSLCDGPIGAAIDTGNLELVKKVCELDPAAANGEIGHVNTLAYACSQSKSADVVKTLLDAGADPNKPAQHTPPYSDISYAVSSGLPPSTIEHFFDAGYRCDDGWAIKWAVREKRSDALQVLFRRGKQLATARFPTEEELIKMAEENQDAQMIEQIKQLYPHAARKKGFIASMAAKLFP